LKYLEIFSKYPPKYSGKFCPVIDNCGEGERPLARPKGRREDNVKMDLQEVGWGLDCIDMAQDRDMWPALVKAVINLRVPYNAGNFLTS
jgi:hypothetical protein